MRSATSDENVSLRKYDCRTLKGPRTHSAVAAKLPSSAKVARRRLKSSVDKQGTSTYGKSNCNLKSFVLHELDAAGHSRRSAPVWRRGDTYKSVKGGLTMDCLVLRKGCLLLTIGSVAARARKFLPQLEI